MPQPGTVFQLVGDGHHFWVVISPVKNGNVLAINITDVQHSPDSPCKLNVGDHPNITKPSVAFYRKAREFDAQAIDREIQSGAAVRQLADCRPDVLQRMIDGAKTADDLTCRFLEYL